MLRSPAIRFVVLGSLLYAARVLTGESTAEAPRESAGGSIIVSADDLQRLHRSYRETIGGQVDDAAHEYLVERFVEDELLYREALALGLHHGDDTIRWRLVEKMRYLGEADTDERDEDVLQRALELGLERYDPVIRNVLIDEYRTMLRYAYGTTPISEAELRSYYESNEERFSKPPRVTFSHVFFSSQTRGDAARPDAEAVLALLRDPPIADAEAFGLGDPFRPGHDVSSQTSHGVARLFGSEFAASVLNVDEGQWAGPFRSAYGYHLVLVTSRDDGGLPPFEVVRSQIAKTVAAERREAGLRVKVAELRTRYDVVLRGGRPPGDDDA